MMVKPATKLKVSTKLIKLKKMKQKKFLISGSFMLALVAFAGSYHAYTSHSTAEEADLLLANVEALATGADLNSGNTVDCYSSSEGKKGASYYDCGPCTKQLNSTGTGDKRTCVTP